MQSSLQQFIKKLEDQWNVYVESLAPTYKVGPNYSVVMTHTPKVIQMLKNRLASLPRSRDVTYQFDLDKLNYSIEEMDDNGDNYCVWGFLDPDVALVISTAPVSLADTFFKYIPNKTYHLYGQCIGFTNVKIFVSLVTPQKIIDTLLESNYIKPEVADHQTVFSEYICDTILRYISSAQIKSYFNAQEFLRNHTAKLTLTETSSITKKRSTTAKKKVSTKKKKVA
jgi:hypothetical protein